MELRLGVVGKPHCLKPALQADVVSIQPLLHVVRVPRQDEGRPAQSPWQRAARGKVGRFTTECPSPLNAANHVTRGPVCVTEVLGGGQQLGHDGLALEVRGGVQLVRLVDEENTVLGRLDEVGSRARWAGRLGDPL